jgi:phytoene synthase
VKAPLLTPEPAPEAEAASSDQRGLEAAYRLCRGIVEQHSKTFYLSSLFLNAEKRRAVWAVYAFCRTADDIIDQVAPAQERLDAIDAWERRLVAAYKGVAADPIYIAFSDAAQRFDIPIEPALDLLRGARMDVTVERYATYEQLRGYCYHVASTVGLLVMPILGVVSPAATGYGIALGRAMQMTNILRDVGEDARMGRMRSRACVRSTTKRSPASRSWRPSRATRCGWRSRCIAESWVASKPTAMTCSPVARTCRCTGKCVPP